MDGRGTSRGDPLRRSARLMKPSEDFANAVPWVGKFSLAKIADVRLRAARQFSQRRLSPASSHQLGNESFPVHADDYRHSLDSVKGYGDEESKLQEQSRCMATIGLHTPAARLRAARKAAGLSQQQVAAELGVAQSTISDAELVHPPKMLATTLMALCARYGLTVDYVMTGSSSDTGHVEAEAARLLRYASPEMRDAAMKVLRAMLADNGPSKRQAS